jgi:predicted permease
VAAQVATAVVVVVGASLLLRSLWRLSSVPVGFDVSRLVTAQITPNASACPNPSRCVAFYEDVMRRTRAHAGVSDTAVISTLPLTGEIPGVAVSIEDHPRQPGDTAFVLWQSAISPAYLRTMGIPLVRGRSFTDADRDGALPVAIISAATAHRFWPNADPIGRRVKPMSSRTWRTIIGVAGDVTDYALAGHLEWIDGTVYLPYGQSEGRARAPWPMTLVARSDADAGLARDLPGLVAAASREAPVSRVQSMRGVVSASLAAPRALAWLLALFAALALTLGAVGIAGVIAYIVAERTREIGIRVALGGRPADILAVTLGETLTHAAVGLIVGVAVSVVGARAIERLLFETTARDPGSLLATVAVVSVVALVAALVPARRALRVNPVDALRVE